MIRKNFFHEYLDFFEHPHREGRFIHIAGTKGKTSTSYYVYKMLLEAGKTAGLFVSPHIFRETERIQRNGKEISKGDLAHYRELIAHAKTILQRPLGFFNEFLLIAFLFFRDNPTDFVVLEVGIGGLHDTTNVIIPEISVISRIKKDHQEILGSWLFQIIHQKLGILKSRRPFIIGKQDFWVSLYIFFITLSRRPYQRLLKHSRIFNLDERSMKISLDHKVITLQGPLYMRENFLLAYSVLYALGIAWQGDFFAHSVPGRMQRIEGYPYAFLDGAHNEIAMRILVKTLRCQFPDRRWKIILCVRQDKDFLGILTHLQKIAEIFILCPWDKEINEEYAPDPLLTNMKKKGLPFVFIEKEKLNSFFRIDDTILVTGSFYHLAPVYDQLRRGLS